MHAFIKLKLGKFKTTVLRIDGSKLNNPYFWKAERHVLSNSVVKWNVSDQIKVGKDVGEQN